MNIYFCCGCERLSSHNYCFACRGRLKRSGVLHRQNFMVYSLYHWEEPGNLRSWIHSLKGGKNPQDWCWIAQELVRHFGYTLGRFPKVWIVAAPRASHHPDHAARFSKALSQILGQPLGPVIYKKSSYKQRFLSRNERLHFQVEIPEINTWSATDSEAVLFVDDVLTTGGTAESVYKALGQPSNFFVWTLAYRGLSCGDASHLL